MANTNLIDFLDSEITGIQNNRISGFQKQLYNKLVQLKSDNKNFAKNSDIDLLTQAQIADSLSQALLETVNKRLVDYATGGTVDLSSYYTATQVDNLIQSKVSANMQSDWNETDTSSPAFINNKPTAVSAFTNDAGYLTKHQSLTDYAKTAYVDKLISDLHIENYATQEYVNNIADNIDLTGYATQDYVKNEIKKIDISSFNLDGYAKVEDVERAIEESGHVTAEELTAKGYLTSIPEEYVTEEQLNAKGYLTEHQSLDGYVTSDALTALLQNYLTAVPDEYITEAELEEKKYLTEHQSLADYVTSNRVNDIEETLTNNMIKLSKTINGLMFVGTYEEYKKAMEEETINEETFTVITKDEKTGYDLLTGDKTYHYHYQNYSCTPLHAECKWGYYILGQDVDFGIIYQAAYCRIYNALRHNGTDEYALYYLLDDTMVSFPTKNTETSGSNTYNNLVIYLKDLHLSQDEINKILSCVHLDNPDLCWKWGYDSQDTTHRYATGNDEVGNKIVYYLELPYYPEEERMLKLATMDRTFVHICNTIEKAYGIVYVPDNFINNAARYTRDEKQKIVKAIHDYLVISNNYGILDDEHYYGGNQIAWSALSEGEYDPVCLAYAQALQYCCWRWGIFAITIIGYTGDTISHAWNSVNYESIYAKDFENGNEWADIDVTWDDPKITNFDSYGEEEKKTLRDYCRWIYFNKPTEMIKNDHARKRFDDGYSSAYPAYPVNATCNTLQYFFKDNIKEDGLLFGGY